MQPNPQANQVDVRPGKRKIWQNRFVLVLKASTILLLSAGAAGSIEANDRHDDAATSMAHPTGTAAEFNYSKQPSVAVSEMKTVMHGLLFSSIQTIRQMHPLTVAGMQIMAVLLVCILLTDNRELERYLRIEFKAPKVDILN